MVPNFGLHLPELAFTEDLEGRVLDDDQPLIQVFGQYLVLAGKMHQPAGSIYLAHRAPGPGDDLGGEDVLDPQLGHDAHQQGVYPGTVGIGQLGDVADAHQHLLLWKTAAGFKIARDRLGEAKHQGIDYRVDDVGHAPGFEAFDVAFQAGLPLAKVGHDYDLLAIHLPCDIQIRAVDAQEVVKANPIGPQYVLAVERIEANREPARLEFLQHLYDVWKVTLGQPSQIDDIGAALAIVLGLGQQRIDRPQGRIGDLGQDPCAIVVQGHRFPFVAEPARDVQQILGSQLDPDSRSGFQVRQIPLAPTGQQDQVDVVLNHQPGDDPLNREERGDGDG